MSIVNIRITENVTPALKKLIASTRDLSQPMRAIAGLLEDLTERAFRDQAQPGGPRWPSLAQSTVESRADRYSRRPGGRRKDGRITAAVAKRISGHRLLQDTGRLAASVEGRSGPDFAQVGAAAVYAAIHQVGGKTRAHTILPKHKKALTIGDMIVKRVQHPGSQIPARPYLPMTAGHDLTAPAKSGILDILTRHFTPEN